MAQVVRDLVPGAQIQVGPGPVEWLPGKPMPVKGALDISRARRELGYEPKYDLKEGLAEEDLGVDVGVVGALVIQASPAILAYLNRLSDLLFVAARVANARAGRIDEG